MIQVVAAVIVNRNRFLIARKKKGKSLEGLWEFPGGKVEPDESMEQSLKRELSEEFQIEIEVKNKETQMQVSRRLFAKKMTVHTIRYALIH